MIVNGAQNKPNLEKAAYTMVEAKIPFHVAMARFAVLYVKAALAHCNGNQTHAALLINLHRNTLAHYIPEGDKKPCQTATIVPEKQSYLNFGS